jgi:hypothetical protein
VPCVDGPVLFLVAVIGTWGTLLVLIAEQAVREIVAWWYRRSKHGNHHPTGPAARTAKRSIAGCCARLTARPDPSSSAGMAPRAPPVVKASATIILA